MKVRKYLKNIVYEILDYIDFTTFKIFDNSYTMTSTFYNNDINI